MEEIKNKVDTARKLCGCYSCCGLRDVGEHTIAGGTPRKTPSSCLAAQVFQALTKPELPLLQHVEIVAGEHNIALKRIEADREQTAALREQTAAIREMHASEMREVHVATQRRIKKRRVEEGLSEDDDVPVPE